MANPIIKDKEDLVRLLELPSGDELQTLYHTAYQTKLAETGPKVYYRGIIEFSNICTKDCYYCGIRRSNTSVERFSMTEEEILTCAELAFDAGYGSIVLQSGERSDAGFVNFVDQLIRKIKALSEGQLGITLSLGEQSADTLTRWFSAGAHRYLLRIETSNPTLYHALHPDSHDYETRLDCLTLLRNIGYQVGTGVMIGLPGQTSEDLADDILFFKKMDIDMIGMGPYIVHHDTPLAETLANYDSAHQLQLGLKMIALTRLFLKDVNIAATTALQALDPRGRELGLQAGANIIMPNVTSTQYRTAYQLYDNKPCVDENATMCRHCLERRIETIGETVGYGEWGDSPHFLRRKHPQPDPSDTKSNT